MESYLIQYKDVDIQHDDHCVVGQATFTVSPGDFIFLIGSVGSGKSSILKTIYGELDLVNAHEANVLGFDMCKIKRSKLPRLRKRLGIVFQDFQLLMDRSVEDNLDFVLRATGWKSLPSRRMRIAEVLNLVGLKHKAYRRPNQLSGGEQQRIAIARAILNKPEIILADEPTGNLDEENSFAIVELLQGIAKEGTAVLMSTHNRQVVKKYPGLVWVCENQQLSDATQEYRQMDTLANTDEDTPQETDEGTSEIVSESVSENKPDSVLESQDISNNQ